MANSLCNWIILPLLFALCVPHLIGHVSQILRLFGTLESSGWYHSNRKGGSLRKQWLLFTADNNLKWDSPGGLSYPSKLRKIVSGVAALLEIDWMLQPSHIINVSSLYERPISSQQWRIAASVILWRSLSGVPTLVLRKSWLDHHQVYFHISQRSSASS